MTCPYCHGHLSLLSIAGDCLQLRCEDCQARTTATVQDLDEGEVT